MDDLGTRGAALIGRLDGAADLAAARLREAEAPIAAVAPALTAVEGAAGEVERLLNGDGAALVAEARTALETVNGLLETDAPQILADVRTAAATVNRVVAEVGADVERLHRPARRAQRPTRRPRSRTPPRPSAPPRPR